jgi:CheY-like chemotaxis protein
MEKIREVFIVDDEPISNTIFEKLAGMCDFAETVVPFVSASDALDHLRQRQTDKIPVPDIIFLDIRMPIVNGWEFLDEFEQMDREYYRDTVVYMLTSSSEQSDINRAKNYRHVEDYIVKPLTLDRLEQIRQKHAGVSID